MKVISKRKKPGVRGLNTYISERFPISCRQKNYTRYLSNKAFFFKKKVGITYQRDTKNNGHRNQPPKTRHVSIQCVLLGQN